MTDYTPTTGQVSNRYASGRRILDARDAALLPIGELETEFDRWLADRDRKVAAEALRRLVADRTDIEEAVRLIFAGAEDPQKMIVDLIVLRARSTADRIEQGGES